MWRVSAVQVPGERRYRLGAVDAVLALDRPAAAAAFEAQRGHAADAGLAYTGDTGPRSGVVDATRGAEFLLSEATCRSGIWMP
jgi:ribonuclease BN (tRNA processing enzyme)